MVDCTEFLDRYSDFRDGCLAPERKDAFEAHLQECESCARYDRAVGGGVQVFRSLPALAPSPDFERRLLNRLYSVQGMGERHASGASFAVTLAICLALGAGAWLPTLRPETETVRLPPIVAHAPYHDLTPVLMQGAARPLGPPVFQSQPEFYGRGLLLEDSAPLTTVAYRPAGAFYFQR